MKPILNKHIDPRFLFTLFAKTIWTIGMKEIHMYYIFGIRIARIHRP